MTEQPDRDPRHLRASNQDREQVAVALHTAMAEGRIEVPELEERLDAVYRAKTLGELEPLTSDLPGHRPVTAAGVALPAPPPEPGSPGIVSRVGGGYPTSSAAVAVMSGATRSGRWVVPRQFTAVAVMGGVELDLTQARFAERQVTITAVAVMGGIEITVPADVTVLVSGIGLMGGFEDHARSDGYPGGPVLRVNGLALMGGVEVKRGRLPEQITDDGRKELR
ncbi:hypothetical protein J2S58_000078 [Nakamurella flavida]|nr:DUF1707 domain-containing protein [Nakamurella flavida]MDP9776455.1 hypothetical protein [Nakamurella flavida]